MPRGGVLPPTPVLAPGSALGSRPRVALSAAQVVRVYPRSGRGAIPASDDRELPPDKQGASFVDRGGNQVYLDKLNELITPPEHATIAWISLEVVPSEVEM